MCIPHPHPHMLLHPNPLFLGFHHSQPLLGAVLGFQLHPSLLSEQEGGGDEQNPAAAAAAAAAHPILGNQSREKIHIPCGPPSSKFFFFFFSLHVTAKLSKTLGKITFTFPGVSLAAGAALPAGFSSRDLLHPKYAARG